MKFILVVMILAVPALWLFPAEWRVAIAAGWVPMMVSEALLSARRTAILSSSGGGAELLMVVVFGFLGRFFLLVFGAILGAKADLYPEGPFMASCLAAIAVGEALSLPAVARVHRRRRSEPKKPGE